MKYEALVSFSGRLTMAKGEVRELSELEMAETIKDLMLAGYIKEIHEEPKISDRFKGKRGKDESE